MRLSLEATKEILYSNIARAPYVAAILNAVTAAEEGDEDARNAYHSKRQKQVKRTDEARYEAADARRRYEETPDAVTEAWAQNIAALEKTAAAEVAKLNAMEGPKPYDGVTSDAVAAEIQKYQGFAHQPRAGLKTVEGSADALKKISADRAKLRAEWLGVLKSPNDLDTAEKNFDRDLDSLVRKHLRAWFVGPAFLPEIDEESGRSRPRRIELPTNPNDGKPDALALLLLSAEPLIRAAGKRRLREAWEKRFEFEGALSPAERDKKAAALTKKIKELEALEAAHIRALALAGECPVIRKDINLKELFALEAVPESKAAFEQEQADRKHPSYVAGRGGNGGMKIIRP